MYQVPVVRIVTHSGCDMSTELAAKLDIIVVPDLVIFDKIEYLNGIDVSGIEFYERLDKSEVLPTTSHPGMGGFLSGFKNIGDAEEILCLTVTGDMSGTYSGACAAAKLWKENSPVPAYIYDTRQVSHGMQLMVIKAAKLAQQGMCAKDIIAVLDEMQSEIGVYFILKSLKNARKGGRIGAIRMLAADALGVKPFLKFNNGTVRDVGITRNFEDGLRRIYNKFMDSADKTEEAIVFHANNLPDAEKIAKKIHDTSPETPIRIEVVGPVIGIYTGSGCVGIAFRRKKKV